MSYLPYVIAAYAVFVLVIGADCLTGFLAVRRAHRRAHQSLAPRRTRTSRPPSTELER